jgi:hypothetical protein
MNMKRICFLYFFIATWLCMEGRGMEIIGSRVLLPSSKGDGSISNASSVIGAEFYEDKGLFFVQETITKAEDNGLVLRSNRQLSSWRLSDHSMVINRMFDRTPNPKSFPCGRVEKSVKLDRVFLCSAESYLEVIDPDNLATVGILARSDDQTIMDFAVDDPRDRILVLSTRKDRSIHLSSYSLLSGEKQQETILPPTNYKDKINLAVAPQKGEIGIAININERPGNKADIYICNDSSGLACVKTARTYAAAQISFLKSQLLVATSNFADNKKDCITAVDPKTGKVSPRAYCSPTGVHYALGVVEGKYVVGFTGVSKRNWFTEETRSVSSSFSAWRAGVPQVAAVVQDPNDYGTFQIELSLVGSRTKPYFIAYQRISNTLYLYSIRE